MKFAWKLKNKEYSELTGHLTGEVVCYIDGEKVLDSLFDLVATKEEWNYLGRLILQGKPYQGYPFICSCGDGECSGIEVEIKDGILTIATNFKDIVITLEDIISFLESLHNFFEENL